jgi:Fe-S-cluster containining protein
MLTGAPLSAVVANPGGPHPVGRPWGPADATCAGCAWAQPAGPGPKVLRCHAAPGRPRVDGPGRACDRFEPGPFDCLACAACCGPAFDAVEVGARDPARAALAPWVVARDGRFQLARTADNHCALLQRPGNHCARYADRPRCCRDFAPGSENCAWARRRSGRSAAWAAPSPGDSPLSWGGAGPGSGPR